MSLADLAMQYGVVVTTYQTLAVLLSHTTQQHLITGPGRTSMSLADLATHYDVVVTTYQTLAADNRGAEESPLQRILWVSGRAALRCVALRCLA